MIYRLSFDNKEYARKAEGKSRLIFDPTVHADQEFGIHGRKIELEGCFIDQRHDRTIWVFHKVAGDPLYRPPQIFSLR